MYLYKMLLLLSLLLNLGLGLTSAKSWVSQYMTHQTRLETTVSTPVLSSYPAKTCFTYARPREPWESDVQGIIVMRGTTHYLVMDREEADRRSAGKKFGFTVSAETFHREYQPAPCPLSWIGKEDNDRTKKPEHAKKKKF